MPLTCRFVIASLGLFLVMPPHATGVGLAVPLVEAVKQADATAVRALLNDRVDVNTPEADGTTALHWAVRLDSLDVTDLLIAAGADVMAANAFDATPLSLAAINGNPAMLEKLLEAGADPNATMAHGDAIILTAARTGRADAIRTLVAHGADVNVTQGAGHTPLMWAAAEGHVDAMLVLLEVGAAVAARTVVPANRLRTGLEGPAPHGFTPLLFAVRAGHLDAVRLLLDAGADVNDTLPDGTSTVVLAATNAHWELGVLLVDRGADPNAAEQGWSALHVMTWVRMPNHGFNPPGPVTTGTMDSLAFARALVERGADVNARMTKEPRNGYRNALKRVGATPAADGRQTRRCAVYAGAGGARRRPDDHQRKRDQRADGGLGSRYSFTRGRSWQRSGGPGLRRGRARAGWRPERDRPVR